MNNFIVVIVVAATHLLIVAFKHLRVGHLMHVLLKALCFRWFLIATQNKNLEAVLNVSCL